MLERTQSAIVRACALALPVFVLAEVNYPHLSPQSQLAIFALLGLVLCFLKERPGAGAISRALDLLLAAAAAFVCAYVAVQTEPAFSAHWWSGQPLGERAGLEHPMDVAVGIVGLLVVLEACRRAIGWALPVLALAFLGYAGLGPFLPSWLLPHRGYGVERIVGQTFLHNQGVFGVALEVMFSYVFLFVVFGALLEATGATGFIIDFTRRLFRGTPGGSAKVAVISSGLMGSLSGSAVANVATTGVFTIPMMKSAGFRPEEAAGVEAAASSGGALMPPVMGAGAYMMLEIIDPPVSYLEVIRAALIPALLYYLSLFLFVHFNAKRIHAAALEVEETEGPAGFRYEGIVFACGLGSLIAFLLAGWSVFRAVSLTMAVIFAVALCHPRTRLTPRAVARAFVASSHGGVPLIAAAACVGVVIGVVTLTGAGTRLPALILPLAEGNLLLALAVLMTISLVLGMGLPSAVCYLLLATLVGPVLGQLGVIPLAAHLFIFYFGMLSMVTPPVALAAYAASSIAGSDILAGSAAAFRFALVGFTLPYMFVLRPQLLLLDPQGQHVGLLPALPAVAIAILGLLPLAAGLAGYLRRPLGTGARALLFLSAALTLVPHYGPWLGRWGVSFVNLIGIALFFAVLVAQGRGGVRAMAAGQPET